MNPLPYGTQGPPHGPRHGPPHGPHRNVDCARFACRRFPHESAAVRDAGTAAWTEARAAARAAQERRLREICLQEVSA
jgi:hypothetical protein